VLKVSAHSPPKTEASGRARTTAGPIAGERAISDKGGKAGTAR
jgi:hypothetical protein